LESFETISSKNFRQLVGALAEFLFRRDADDSAWLRSSFRNAVVASVALFSIFLSRDSFSSSFGCEDCDDFEMNFLLVLITSTRRDASVILTPGTGDSVGTRGAVDAAATLELITAATIEI